MPLIVFQCCTLFYFTKSRQKFCQQFDLNTEPTRWHFRKVLQFLKKVIKHIPLSLLNLFGRIGSKQRRFGFISVLSEKNSVFYGIYTNIKPVSKQKIVRFIRFNFYKWLIMNT